MKNEDEKTQNQDHLRSGAGFSRLTLAEREFIEKSLSSLTPIKEISRVLSKSRTTISAEINKNGGSKNYSAKLSWEKSRKRINEHPGRGYYIKVPEDQIEIAKQMRKNGDSYQKIADKLGISYSSLYYYLSLAWSSSRIEKNNNTSNKSEFYELIQEQIDILFDSIKDLNKQMTELMGKLQ